MIYFWYKCQKYSINKNKIRSVYLRFKASEFIHNIFTYKHNLNSLELNIQTFRALFTLYQTIYIMIYKMKIIIPKNFN